MNRWRNRWTTVLTLLSVLAWLMPAAGWACPMSGRMGSAKYVCPSMTEGAPCARPGSACCKPVSLPRSTSLPGLDPETSLTAVQFAAVSSAKTHRIRCAPHAALIPAPIIFPAPCADAFEWAIPDYLRSARQGPPLSPGRAPPVV
jgi:hypothetical protein